MVQKFNPHALRVGVIKDWDSKWYAEQNEHEQKPDDEAVRRTLKIGKVIDWDAKFVAARMPIAGTTKRITK